MKRLKRVGLSHVRCHIRVREERILTVVKQVAITSPSHMKSLGSYLDSSNGRHEVLAMDGQNLTDVNDWEREFDRTREAYGHNVPGRAGAKCTYAYHQIIGFNPDECDVNGGKLSAEDCMAFAREWVERFYPHQEAAWAIHKERCATDGSERYAVHVAINRTMLDGSGRRLDEGRASRQKVLHAARMREMDERYGLRQLERGQRNSASHSRQPSRAEQRAKKAGLRRSASFETDLDHVRRVVRERVEKVSKGNEPNKMRALSSELEGRGIRMRMSRDRSLKKADVVFEYRPTYDRRDSGGERVRVARISGHKLGRGFSMSGLSRSLSGFVAREVQRATARAVYRAVDEAMGEDR